MEIHLPPEKAAHLAELAATTGRSAAEIVQEAVALWEERENERALVKFRQTLDDAEASIARGEGSEVTRETMRDLSEDIKRRGRERLAEKQPPR